MVKNINKLLKTIDFFLFDFCKINVTTIMLKSTSNPKLNSSINPKLNSSINPRLNSTINPRLNSSINPRLNSSINPRLNSSINPRLNSSINPRLNSSINPRLNSSINPRLNSSINPRLNSNFKGYNSFNLDLESNGFFINTINPNVLIFFNTDNEKIGHAVKIEKGFFIFDLDNSPLAFVIENGKGGYNKFDLNNEWIGIILPN